MSQFAMFDIQQQDRGARFDDSGRYRLSLWRVWNPESLRCCWVMLNPSTADASADDPTIRRCISFARSWGYGGITVVNPFAWRTTYPRDLRNVADPVGKGNDEEIMDAARSAGIVIAGWGRCRSDRASHVLNLLTSNGVSVYRVARTKQGHPWHPLYVRGDARPELHAAAKVIQ